MHRHKVKAKANPAAPKGSRSPSNSAFLNRRDPLAAVLFSGYTILKNRSFPSTPAEISAKFPILKTLSF